MCPVIGSCSCYNRLGELKITGVISDILHPADEGGVSGDVLTHCNRVREMSIRMEQSGMSQWTAVTTYMKGCQDLRPVPCIQ